MFLLKGLETERASYGSPKKLNGLLGNATIFFSARGRQGRARTQTISNRLSIFSNLKTLMCVYSERRCQKVGLSYAGLFKKKKHTIDHMVFIRSPKTPIRLGRFLC